MAAGVAQLVKVEAAFCCAHIPQTQVKMFARC